MEGDRSWMYARLINKRLNPEFFLGVTSFLDYAFSVPSNIIDGNCIRCPCAKCCNSKWFDRDTVERHLNTKGFRNLYQTWYMHGEEFPDSLIHNVSPSSEEDVEEDDEPNEFVQMVLDAAGHEFSMHVAEEPPNPEAQLFYDLLKAADEPIWDGCKKEHTRLSCVAELLTIKSDFNMTKNCFNRIVLAIKKWLPTNNKLPPDYYQCRKLVKDLGMGYDKIDACPKDCMLYYGNNREKDKCDVCQHPRFKNEGATKKSKRIPHKVLPYIPITPRLRRLFICPTSAKQMRWHKDGVHEKEGVMVHPADGQAWKNFDRKHPDFAAELRNVRLGLCADGFSPFNIGGRTYTCWPVFIVCYNLPLGLVMQSQYIFMSLLIPGPDSPGKSIDIYLKPLVDELNSLWINGIEVYDSFRKENFTLKAALMWTINDFPAYAMLSGWSTKGRLGCPVCMEDTKAFQLEFGGKVCHFDCHRRFLCEDHPFRFQTDSFKKDTVETDPPPRRLSGEEIHARVMSLGDVTFGKVANKERLPGFGVEHNWLKKSIFWELPYWPDILVRHFIDVMHLEMNFF